MIKKNCCGKCGCEPMLYYIVPETNWRGVKKHQDERKTKAEIVVGVPSALEWDILKARQAGK